MARTDAFFAKSGRRPDILTISDRFFDENLIDFFEQLLDDRRSLDDTFIASARMRDVEKTLKNLDRAHKIRVRRRFADPRSTRHGLQTTSKIHRKIEDKFVRKNDRKTRRKSRLGTPKIDVSGCKRREVASATRSLAGNNHLQCRKAYRCGSQQSASS